MKTLLSSLNCLMLSMIICTMLSCGKKDAVTPSQVLLNTDIENGASNPDYWFFDPGNSGAYTGTWTSEEATSKSHALKIDATAAQTTAFSYWSQLYTETKVGLKLPVGKDLTLSVKIKGKNLTGQGISIAIRADNSINPGKEGSTFVTTQGGIQISGTFDWKTYTVKMTSLRSDAIYLYVFLVYLPNTTGSVYFDDVTLTY